MGRSTSEDEGDEAGTTSLEISVTPSGEAPTKIWTLRCPDGGTLPDAAEACSKLESLDDPFAPVPHERLRDRTLGQGSVPLPRHLRCLCG
jgi:hypothetical protein